MCKTKEYNVRGSVFWSYSFLCKLWTSKSNGSWAADSCVRKTNTLSVSHSFLLLLSLSFLLFSENQLQSFRLSQSVLWPLSVCWLLYHKTVMDSDSNVKFYQARRKEGRQIDLGINLANMCWFNFWQRCQGNAIEKNNIFQ